MISRQQPINTTFHVLTEAVGLSAADSANASFRNAALDSAALIHDSAERKPNMAFAMRSDVIVYLETQEPNRCYEIESPLHFVDSGLGF